MGRDQIALAPFGDSPSFCNQQIRLARSEIEHIADAPALEVNVIDSFRVLACEPDFHTRLD
jgi:hypothetical protein